MELLESTHDRTGTPDGYSTPRAALDADSEAIAGGILTDPESVSLAGSHQIRFDPTKSQESFQCAIAFFKLVMPLRP